MKKIKVGLVFGGKSSEHEISLISAWNIYHGLNKSKYDISLIGIDKDGGWHFGKSEEFWKRPEGPKTVSLNMKTPLVSAVNKRKQIYLIDLSTGKDITKIDVFFPITHGSFGEDGCLQGYFETIGAMYVGAGVLGSALGMDKDVAKRLLREAGLNQPKFHVLRKNEDVGKKLGKIIADLKFPIFVKPACQGSSVGVSKTKNKEDLFAAMDVAFNYDGKIILEEAIVGREIECGVLGNGDVITSSLGEISMKKGFYSYDAKYVDENAATPVLDVKVPSIVKKKIQSLAVKIFKLMECDGLSRVDFFLTADNDIYINEINTLPGFTNISMYPKMFEKSGIEYKDLLDKLIMLAIERKRKN